VKLRVIYALLLLLISSFGAPLFAQPAAEKIDRVVARYHEAGLLNGVVLVSDAGRVIYSKGFGYSNFELKVPNTPATRFRIGSVTMPFTAVLVLQQVDKGKIKLDEPISTYLPSYRKDIGGKVTVRHLLTHMSGIPSYSGADMETMTSFDKPNFAARYCSKDLVSEPGKQFAYNNCGYFLLGLIAEQATGKSYAELLRENILIPLEMKDTGLDDGRAVVPQKASGYDHTLLSGVVSAPWHDIRTAFGAGDMYSTAGDLLKFDEAIYSGKLLSAELTKEMFTPANPRCGLSWFIDQPGNGFAVGGSVVHHHHGNIWGFFTNVAHAPERNATVIVLDNTHSSAFDRITTDIFKVLYGKPVTLAKASIADAIGSVLQEKGVAAALDRYAELKAAKPTDFDFENWRALNELGYELLRANRATEAAEVFGLNATNFPQNWEVWDSLGDGYLGGNQKDKAIDAYQKSLELNSNNTNATSAIASLRAAAQSTR
jgi:CubicO group peptidase (beta-lactamase class C family)